MPLCDCLATEKRYGDLEAMYGRLQLKYSQLQQEYGELQESSILLHERYLDLEEGYGNLQEAKDQEFQLYKHRSIAMGDMWIEEREDFHEFYQRLQSSRNRLHEQERDQIIREVTSERNEKCAREREVCERELCRMREELQDYYQSERFLCQLMKELQRPDREDRLPSPKRCGNTSSPKKNSLNGSSSKRDSSPRKTSELTRLDSRIKDVMSLFQTQQKITQRVKGQLQAERNRADASTAEVAALKKELHKMTGKHEEAMKTCNRYVRLHRRRAGVTAQGSPLAGEDVARICFWGDMRKAKKYNNTPIPKRLTFPTPGLSTIP